MLEIKNLHVTVDSKPLLKGINLTVKSGEVHAIMGPNGSGKSTLANVIAGKENYHITEGSIYYNNNDLSEYSVEQRARLGIFLAFQYPVEIPGVSNISFLKAAVNAIRVAQQKPELDAIEFLTFIREKIHLIDMDESFLYRSVNEGFSGGEKKRNEILQMAALEPSLAVLDETDSGLDIDALKTVSDGVNQMWQQDRSIIVVTHYQRLLNYIKPDFVHVLANGQIIKSGDKQLALELENKGYAWLEEVA